MQQRQPSQQLGVQSVGLGVLGVVGAQIRRLLGGHQHHGCAPASEPRGQRHPGVAGRFHHHQHLVGVAGQLGPEGLEFRSTGTELVTRPHDPACLVRASRPMLRPARDVDSQTNLHLLLLPVEVLDGVVTTAGVSTRHSLSEITSSQSRPWRRQVPNRATAPRRRGPRPPPRSTGKESAPAAPIAIAAVTDERRLLMNLRGRPDPTGSISTPLSMNVAARLEVERQPGAGPVGPIAAHRGHRQPRPVALAVPQDRRAAAGCPGTPHRRGEADPALIPEHDPGAAPARVVGGSGASRS